VAHYLLEGQVLPTRLLLEEGFDFGIERDLDRRGGVIGRLSGSEVGCVDRPTG
jgi:hypothetical protein